MKTSVGYSPQSTQKQTLLQNAMLFVSVLTGEVEGIYAFIKPTVLFINWKEFITTFMLADLDIFALIPFSKNRL